MARYVLDRVEPLTKCTRDYTILRELAVIIDSMEM